MEGRSTIANLDEPSKRCVLIALMHFLKTGITIDGHSFNTNPMLFGSRNGVTFQSYLIFPTALLPYKWRKTRPSRSQVADPAGALGLGGRDERNGGTLKVLR